MIPSVVRDAGRERAAKNRDGLTMKITYSAAASRDGFIAKEDGDVSWLDDLDIAASETDLAQFFARIDGLLMGRATYDFVYEYGSWPYEDRPSWVLTHRPLEPLSGANLIVSTELDNVIQDATQRGLAHLWLVGGGQLASACLNQNLLTEIHVAEMPVTLEQGIPLFAEHRLDEIPYRARRVLPKQGYQQIELALKEPFDHDPALPDESDPSNA
ncbi:MAG: dihydrofolate reductase family protein [Planctomycetota bacterium]